MFLSVVFLQNEVGQSRLGIIVGKRFVHRAVDRNRIRRIVREAFRHASSSILFYDIVFVVRSSNVVALSNDELRCLVKTFFKQLPESP